MKNRIQQIMDREGMTPGRFADSIGIQRSALSHILNGRNNPSLDVVMKILSRFEYLSTDWLMFGGGPMFKHQLATEENSSVNSSTTSSSIQSNVFPDLDFDVASTSPAKPIQQDDAFIDDIKIQMPDSKRRVARIMIFYTDNTFDNFIPE